MGPSKGSFTPLPPVLPVLLTVKAGQRDKSRKTVATYEFDHVVDEGFNVLFSKAANYLDRAVATHNESPETTGQGKTKLVKIPSIVKVYLKPSTNATQKEYICIETSNYSAALTAAWNNASIRRGGQMAYKLELFVYLKRKDGDSNDEAKVVPESTRMLQIDDLAEAPRLTPPTPAVRMPADFRPLDFLINGQIVPMLVNVEQLRALLSGDSQP
ncbi:hypothetical protein ACHHYP_00468 [Achlya hypogyna]|uniref:Uncharacterized protein n=1 Tax=Achlya hypogyna TaxID=1202772 RepID=A0A1V9ZAP0_ACHHY|nr:hypothetical protein ACHHYP_00468 [Achlya hypogyna]